MDSQGPPTTAPLPAPAPGCCCWWHCRCQYRCCRRNLLPHTSMHAPNILTVQQGGPLPPLTGQSATPPTAEHPLKANSTMTESNQSWICVINGLVSLGPLYSQRRRRPLRGVPLMHPPLNSHRLHQSFAATIDICNHHQASIISQSQALNALHPHARRASTSGVHGRCVACKMFQAHASHHA